MSRYSCEVVTELNIVTLWGWTAQTPRGGVPWTLLIHMTDNSFNRVGTDSAIAHLR